MPAIFLVFWGAGNSKFCPTLERFPITYSVRVVLFSVLGSFLYAYKASRMVMLDSDFSREMQLEMTR